MCRSIKITIDTSGSNKAAIEAYHSENDTTIEIRQVKYLNYVKKISKRLGKSIDMVPAGVMADLRNYSWPGNIRELENVLERAVINSSGPKLRLMDELKKPHERSTTNAKGTMQEVERNYIIQVFEETQWKVSGKNSASEVLGLDRSTLHARMRKLDIRKE